MLQFKEESPYKIKYNILEFWSQKYTLPDIAIWKPVVEILWRRFYFSSRNLHVLPLRAKHCSYGSIENYFWEIFILDVYCTCIETYKTKIDVIQHPKTLVRCEFYNPEKVSVRAKNTQIIQTTLFTSILFRCNHRYCYWCKKIIFDFWISFISFSNYFTVWLQLWREFWTTALVELKCALSGPVLMYYGHKTGIWTIYVLTILVYRCYDSQLKWLFLTRTINLIIVAQRNPRWIFTSAEWTSWLLWNNCPEWRQSVITLGESRIMKLENCKNNT